MIEAIIQYRVQKSSIASHPFCTSARNQSVTRGTHNNSIYTYYIIFTPDLIIILLRGVLLLLLLLFFLILFISIFYMCSIIVVSLSRDVVDYNAPANVRFVPYQVRIGIYIYIYVYISRYIGTCVRIFLSVSFIIMYVCIYVIRTAHTETHVHNMIILFRTLCQTSPRRKSKFHGTPSAAACRLAAFAGQTERVL